VHDSPGEPVTAPPADPGHAVLRIASVNLESGGLSETGDDVRWHKSVAALLAQDPHVVLCQEMTAPSAFRLQAHLWRTANKLGMTPVLGPPAPASFSSNHTAVLVRTSAGLAILDTGPPAGPQPGSPAAWCQALVQVPGISYPVCFYSVHLPARSAVEQLSQAQRLASRIAQDGALAVAGGDWNCYAPADALTPETLAAMPPHLRPPRMRVTAGVLEANYDVHHALAVTGLTDTAAVLPPGSRDPRELTPTGINGGGRVDRFYLTQPLAGAASRYEQRDTGGSDHQALLLTLDLTAAAAAVPAGPVP
jgi:endonuclease/exonuclease/phosphatase family metal-dependent hydrolase